jgi:hypothetical protein
MISNSKPYIRSVILFTGFAAWVLPATITPAQLSRPPQAQPSSYAPALVSEIKRVQAAALESDYAYRQVAHLSNNIGPRLSGSPQAQTAVEYVAAELRKLGLEVQLEKVMVPHWVRGEETAALTEYPGMAPSTTQKVVLTALGGSVATSNAGLTAEVVVVNNFDELQALGRDKVAGKIVLFNAKFDHELAENGFAGQAYGQAVAYRGAGPSAAARLGGGRLPGSISGRRRLSSAAHWRDPLCQRRSQNTRGCCGFRRRRHAGPSDTGRHSAYASGPDTANAAGCGQL